MIDQKEEKKEEKKIEQDPCLHCQKPMYYGATSCTYCAFGDAKRGGGE